MTMLLAIVAISGFQLYWLFKNYKEEKRVLEIKTNALFREAVFQSQLEKSKLDTSIHWRVARRESASQAQHDIVQQRIEIDTLRNLPSKTGIIISMDKEMRGETFSKIKRPADSLRQTVRFFNRPGGQALIQVLQGVDSLQDSVTVKEVSAKYDSLLKSEQISLGFSISSRALAPQKGFFIPEMDRPNEVTIGFFKPVTFILTLGNTTAYLLQRLLVPILVSLLLIGLTIFSFVLMYRSLLQQRRLSELKNEFVSNITHELKTPIATVGVAIEALKNFNAMNDPQRTKEYLDISAAEVHRLGLLVDKVLKLSMFENKEIQLHTESFDLLQLTQEVMASMKLQFEKQGALVTLETRGTNFVIEADKLHITSVIYNLLDNALKYSNNKPEIDVHISSHEQHVSLSVSDKGIGIPKEYKGKIFDKFFRIPGGDRHNIKGYGLGLSYVNHIVQRHMGYVEVKSEVGKGSTFIVNIPYKEAEEIRYDEFRTVRKEGIKL